MRGHGNKMEPGEPYREPAIRAERHPAESAEQDQIDRERRHMRMQPGKVVARHPRGRDTGREIKERDEPAGATAIGCGKSAAQKHEAPDEKRYRHCPCRALPWSPCQAALGSELRSFACRRTRVG